MFPEDMLLSHLGPSVLLLLPLLLPSTSAFFPNIWSLLAAPGSITHQDLTEEAALNVTLQLFLEQPPPGRPPLHLENFLVSTPGSYHIPVRSTSFPGPSIPRTRVLLAKGKDITPPPRSNSSQGPDPEIRSPSSLQRFRKALARWTQHWQFLGHSALIVSC